MVESAGMNADEDFVGAKVRLVDVGVTEDARIAVLVKDNGFHGRPPEA